jgi:hypothetical protein
MAAVNRYLYPTPTSHTAASRPAGIAAICIPVVFVIRLRVQNGVKRGRPVKRRDLPDQPQDVTQSVSLNHAPVVERPDGRDPACRAKRSISVMVLHFPIIGMKGGK